MSMNPEKLSDSLGYIGEDLYDEAVSPVRKKRRIALPIAAAAAVAAVLTAAVGAAGGLGDIKNFFGTVTGVEYVGDASEDFDIAVTGCTGGVPEIRLIPKDAEKPPIISERAEITATEYEISGAGELLRKRLDSADGEELKSLGLGRLIEYGRAEKTGADGAEPVGEELLCGVEIGESGTGTLSLRLVEKYADGSTAVAAWETYAAAESPCDGYPDISSAGELTVKIGAVVIYEKANQPLELRGSWVCELR